MAAPQRRGLPRNCALRTRIVALRYNTGRAIARNGAELSWRLQQLFDRSILRRRAIGSDGLQHGRPACRSALAQAQAQGRLAAPRRALICLARRTAARRWNATARPRASAAALRATRAPFARLADARSAGVKDLRHGRYLPTTIRRRPRPACPALIAAALGPRGRRCAHAPALATAWCRWTARWAATPTRGSARCRRRCRRVLRHRPHGPARMRASTRRCATGSRHRARRRSPARPRPPLPSGRADAQSRPWFPLETALVRSSHVETHRSDRVGWLRAAVLGANDGVISVASLMVGVAASGANARRSCSPAWPAGGAPVHGRGRIRLGEVPGRHRAGRPRQGNARAGRGARARAGGTHRDLRAPGPDRALAAQVAQQLTAHDALAPMRATSWASPTP